MRIKVFDEETEKSLRFIFPNFLMFNSMTAKFISKSSKNKLNISGKQMRLIRKEIRRAKRYHRKLVIIEVEENGKNVVKIEL